MKFIDTKGREWKMDIRPSRWPRKATGEGKGKFQSEVGEILAERWPTTIILEEFPCKGEGLTLDFFLPRRKIAVEVQGTQHSVFNPFFHADKAAFLASKMRDKRKVKWCEVNDILLLKIEWGESKENILNMLP